MGRAMPKLKRRLRKTALQAVASGGFFTPMKRHLAIFVPRGRTLVVTFDNMKSREDRAPAQPWGHEFIKETGYSHLSVSMQRRNDWFRHPELEDFFDGLAADEFFKSFDRVLFYGSSMGGYGALSYSAAVPGSEVIAFAPQTSLDPAVAPFETRYEPGFARGDWQGRYADAALGASLSRRVTIFADPWQLIDASHIARLPQDNLVWAKCPFAGHTPARVMHVMGILRNSVLEAFAGTVTEGSFRKNWRRHRVSALHTRRVLNRAVGQGHPQLALRTIRGLRVSHPEFNFGKVAASARENLSAAA